MVNPQVARLAQDREIDGFNELLGFPVTLFLE
jgi:hypothetical protein